MKQFFLMIGASVALFSIGCSKSSSNRSDTKNNLQGVYLIPSESSDTAVIQEYAYVKSNSEGYYVTVDSQTQEVIDLEKFTFKSGDLISGGKNQISGVCSNQDAIEEGDEEPLSAKDIEALKKSQLNPQDAQSVIAATEAFISSQCQSSPKVNVQNLPKVDPSDVVSDDVPSLNEEEQQRLPSLDDALEGEE